VLPSWKAKNEDREERRRQGKNQSQISFQVFFSIYFQAASVLEIKLVQISFLVLPVFLKQIQWNKLDQSEGQALHPLSLPT